MFKRFIICFVLFIAFFEIIGMRIKRGIELTKGHDEPKGISIEISGGGISEIKQALENTPAIENGKFNKKSSDGGGSGGVKYSESHLIDELNHEKIERSIKDSVENCPILKIDKGVEADKSFSGKFKRDNVKSARSEDKVPNKGLTEVKSHEAVVKHKEDLTNIEELKHFHAGSGDVAARKTPEVKQDMKKTFKPDLDIFLYSNMPQLYKIPSLYEIFNGKEELSPYEHFYPYKWLQRRSPIQSAFEIANMMVKVGLDELDSDDYYNEQFPFMDTPGKLTHRMDRSFEKSSDFCPLHSLQKIPDGNNQKVVQVCSCHLMKKNAGDEHDHEREHEHEYEHEHEHEHEHEPEHEYEREHKREQDTIVKLRQLDKKETVQHH